MTSCLLLLATTPLQHRFTPKEKVNLQLEKQNPFLNPIALKMAKTLQSFDHSECNRVKK